MLLFGCIGFENNLQQNSGFLRMGVSQSNIVTPSHPMHFPSYIKEGSGTTV